ncbi:branched-chain amino acid ABC transporter permease [Pengzhenrongella frigida]|uniref:Branched-chain amino acid ABC transporter permease n=1 Tax=Pengzhenrongella frigida TaxID=1259133 RepID=A0A4Q5N3E4_9MICO|nr:branched-chain amino acid ABC transporter permease [Cellulomonas sp. HLT2-17]RYV52752.1 branched-chain amino acid ABC transporter permease [Cellulomonas sp. HLT2-17]
MDWTRILGQVAGEIVAPTTAAYALAAIGLNIHFGLTGLLNMGQAGFMLLGAYSFAIATIAGWPLWAAVLVAVASAVVFATILGIPTLKLRGDYLAIVTIAAAEIVRLIGRSTSMTRITGGNAGLAGEKYKYTFEELSPFPDGEFSLGPWQYSNNLSDSWWLRIVAWTVVGLACLLMWRLMNSPWGRVLKGVREDEDAVRSLGKNVFAYKMQSLVLGGVLGALAGILFVLPRAVQADSLGRPVTFYIWTILLLGGAAAVFGPVLGSILLWTVLMLIKTVMRDVIPTTVMRSEQIEMFGWVLVGIALMLLVIFRPQGILGDKKELAIRDH